ncbi:MAG: CRISPR-associated endonuclease Cas2 [Bacteroidota bacterium]
MWILLFFDLPTRTAAHRRAYKEFRKELKKQHFRRLQYSVYARHVAAKNSAHITTQMCELFPKRGDMRIIRIADQQYHQSIHIHHSQRIAVHLSLVPLLTW